MRSRQTTKAKAKKHRWTPEQARLWGWANYSDRANWGHAEYAAFEFGDFSHKECASCRKCQECFPCAHKKPRAKPASNEGASMRSRDTARLEKKRAALAPIAAKYSLWATETKLPGQIARFAFRAKDEASFNALRRELQAARSLSYMAFRQKSGNHPPTYAVAVR